MSVPCILPSPLFVGGASVTPGTKAVLDLPLTELSDGTIIRLPIVVINGARPGPRLYVGAAIHGDEATGVSIIAGVIKDLDPQALSGSIIAVPVQHPLAFHADHRIPVSQFMKSPLDQAPIDAWTCFPGDSEGNLSQQLAAKLFELIKLCSFAFDIHTPTRGGRYVPISILPGPSLGDNGKKALWLAEQCSRLVEVDGNLDDLTVTDQRFLGEQNLFARYDVRHLDDADGPIALGDHPNDPHL